MVPPAPADRARRRPRPGTTCAAGATTARWCAGSVSAGRPTDGTRCAPPSDWTRTSPRGPDSASSTSGAGSRTPSGPGCCSRSATRRAIRSPSAAASCRAAATRPSTRTPPRRRSTRSAGPSTPSTGPSRTSSPPGEVVVCEGYTDVIGFFEAGVPRAVATCGTALAEEHVKLLKNFATRRGAGLRRRRRRPVGGRSLLRVGAQAGDRRGRGRPAAGIRPGRPGPVRPRGAAGRRHGGQAVPPVPTGADPGRRRPRPPPRAGPGAPTTRWSPWPSTRTTWSATST